MSQMMHDPSNDEEIAWLSFLLIPMLETLDRCSFKDTSMICVYLPILHTRTSPSMPPDTIFWQSAVPAMAVAPWLCASLMAKSNLPD